MWFCYMVRCSDGSLYVGMTNDLEKRIKEHNWGVKSEFTRKRRPVALLWKEVQPDRDAARRREKEIKGWSQKKKLQLVGESTTSAEGTLRPAGVPQGEGE